MKVKIFATSSMSRKEIINIKTLKDLKDIVKKNKEEIIFGIDDDGKYFIEIYDDYRE